MITGGIVSMISASLMFTKYHDLMTTISSIFGLIVVLGIIRSMYHSSLTIYKITGLICLMLLLINNLIYYTTYKVEWLPLIQKITFAVVLSWVIGLNFQIRKRLIMRKIKGN